MTTRKERAISRRRQQKTNTILLVAGGLLVVIAVGFLLSVKSSSQALDSAQVGKPLGDFSLTDTNS